MEQQQNRFKSWALWLSVAGALWVILSAFGVTKKLGIDKGEFDTMLDAVGTVLIAFGICNNPTSKQNF